MDASKYIPGYDNDCVPGSLPKTEMSRHMVICKGVINIASLCSCIFVTIYKIFLA